MIKYIKPSIRKELTEASGKLVEDLTKAIVGQIRIFEGKSTGPGAIYGISRCLRMLHEHFEAVYTEEAKKHLIRLKYETEPRTIREVYSLSRKIDKNDRLFYVEHTDGGIKKLAIDMLGMYNNLNGNNEDISIIRNYIENNSFFIIKHKENDKSINEKSRIFS